MESNNLEDTNPTPTTPESDLEDTKPRRVRPAAPLEAETAPTPTSSEGAQLASAQAEGDSLAATVPLSTGVQPPASSPVTGFIDEDYVQSIMPTVRMSSMPEEPTAGEETRPTALSSDMKGFEDTAATVVPPPSAGKPPTATDSVRPDQRGRPSTTRTVRRRPPGSSQARQKRWQWLLLPVLGLLALAIIAVISGVGGYSSGISERRSAERTQSAQAADEQFQLGLQDMSEGNFFRARQRFEYVIQINPNYPGATDKLAEALLYLNATATPTLLPSATITPTPDVRGSEDLFNQAQQAILNSDWNTAMDALLALRQKDPAYRPVDIDGMLFLSLRNRGRDKIVHADLEGGIYDLTLASNFGPLDAEAQGLLNWTQLYITGASFWDLDWEQVIYYFAQVAPQMPNLMDGSGMTANERLRLAYFEYGNVLASQGQFCKALQMYNLSLAIAPDPAVQTALANAEKGCSGGGEPSTTGTPKPGKKRTPTPPAP